jgi:hypothetical protein
MVRALASCLVVIIVMVISVRAEASRVVVLRPAAAGAALRESIGRTEAELRAEGFAVVVRDAPPGVPPREALERAASEVDTVAAVSLFLAPSGAAADVWVTDRITGKTSMRTVRVDDLAPAERARALAIRAVELLRASLIEATAAPTRDQPRASPIPADVERWLDPDDSPLGGFGAEIGVALLTSFDGMDPAGAPLLRLSYATRAGWLARVSFVGPAFGAQPGGARGSAAVRQELLTLDVGYAPAVDWGGLWPIVWVGGGFYHLRAVGELFAPFESQSDEVWAAAAIAGAGLGYQLSPELTALLDVSLVLTNPRAVVTIFGEPIGSAGRPSLSSSLGVAAHF